VQVALVSRVTYSIQHSLNGQYSQTTEVSWYQNVSNSMTVLVPTGMRSSSVISTISNQHSVYLHATGLPAALSALLKLYYNSAQDGRLQMTTECN